MKTLEIKRLEAELKELEQLSRLNEDLIDQALAEQDVLQDRWEAVQAQLDALRGIETLTHKICFCPVENHNDLPPSGSICPLCDGKVQ